MRQKNLNWKRGFRAGVSLLSLLSLVFLVSACATKPPLKPETVTKGDYSYTKEYITYLIEDEVRKNGITGLSIALVDGQETVWAQGFGYAVKSQNIKATADTVYMVGSISKLFTATAIMQLAEQRRIDIDKPLKAYLPEFEIKSRFSDAGPITLRSMLTHHSGLPSDRLKGWAYGTRPPEGYSEEFLKLPALLKDEYVARPPNRAFAYSNLGFSLLGVVVSRVSGQGFSDYVDQAILRPLGMGRSSFVMNDVLRPYLSKGYSKGKEEDIPYIRDLPAGSLAASVNDLAKFMKMIFAEGRGENGKVLEAETLREMLRPQNSGVPLDLNFQIGIAYWLSSPSDLDSAKSAWHGGDIPPFHSMFITLPDHQLGVAVLTNSDEGASSVTKIATQALKSVLEAKTGIKAIEEEKSSVAIKLDREKVGSYQGFYASPLGLSRVAIEGSQLKIKLAGEWLDLNPYSDNNFSFQYKLLGLIPLDVELLESLSFSFHTIDGRQYGALYFGGIMLGLAEKIEPVPVPPSWMKRTGKYEILNPDSFSFIKDISLVYDGESSLLLFRLKVLEQEQSFPLNPLSETEAIAFGEGRNLGEAIRIVSVNGEERLIFSGYELKLKERV